MARDCDKPRDASIVTCRNCEEGKIPFAGMAGHSLYPRLMDDVLVGHFSRDCPQKKDWSKVKCNNCGESEQSAKDARHKGQMLTNVTVGHTIKRCLQAASEGFGQGNNDIQTNGAGDDWNTNTAAPLSNENTDGDAEKGGWSPAVVDGKPGRMVENAMLGSVYRSVED